MNKGNTHLAALCAVEVPGEKLKINAKVKKSVVQFTTTLEITSQYVPLKFECPEVIWVDLLRKKSSCYLWEKNHQELLPFQTKKGGCACADLGKVPIWYHKYRLWLTVTAAVPTPRLLALIVPHVGFYHRSSYTAEQI